MASASAEAESQVRILAQQPVDHGSQPARVNGRIGVVGDHGGQAREGVVSLKRGPPLDRRVQ
jgi:hypothetical protein